MRWTGTSQSYSRPDGWAAMYRTGIDSAASDMRTRSEFSWNRVGSGVGDWGNWNDPGNPGIAGVTAYESYNGTTCRLGDLDFFLNFPHFAGHNAGQVQCTAIHEFGHGLVLEHSSGFVVMNANHQYRCPDNLIKTLTQTDIYNVNGLY